MSAATPENVNAEIRRLGYIPNAFLNDARIANLIDYNAHSATPSEEEFRSQKTAANQAQMKQYANQKFDWLMQNTGGVLTYSVNKNTGLAPSASDNPDDIEVRKYSDLQIQLMADEIMPYLTPEQKSRLRYTYNINPTAEDEAVVLKYNDGLRTEWAANQFPELVNMMGHNFDSPMWEQTIRNYGLHDKDEYQRTGKIVLTPENQKMFSIMAENTKDNADYNTLFTDYAKAYANAMTPDKMADHVRYGLNRFAGDYVKPGGSFIALGNVPYRREDALEQPTAPEKPTHTRNKYRTQYWGSEEFLTAYGNAKKSGKKNFWFKGRLYKVLDGDGGSRIVTGLDDGTNVMFEGQQAPISSVQKVAETNQRGYLNVPIQQPEIKRVGGKLSYLDFFAV